MYMYLDLNVHLYEGFEMMPFCFSHAHLGRAIELDVTKSGKEANRSLLVANLQFIDVHD